MISTPSIAQSGDLEYVQYDSFESGVCSSVSPGVCGYVALIMANMVKSQVPELPEELPTSVSLYFQLVQRQALVDPAGHRIFYGTHYTKFGDLRVPKGSGPFPVAIVVHGGGWRSRVTLDYTAPLADALACAGIATWNIEYRRLGADGVWPAMFEDVAAATDFLRELALYYPLDLTQVIAIGHSSGGHLALWLAARDRIPVDAQLYMPDPLPIKGVLALAGVADLKRFIEVVPMYRDTLRELMGSEEGATEEEIAQRMKEASPSEYLPLGKPQVFINGDLDPYVPLQLAQEYLPMATAAGDTVRVIALENAGHFESVDPADLAAAPAIWTSILGLLGLHPLPEGNTSSNGVTLQTAVPSEIF